MHNNDAGRQAAHKNARFLVEFRQTTLYTHVLMVYINFQCQQKKNLNKLAILRALSL
jgi:hypothetical protein